MTTPHYGPVRRVAALSDVHGNIPALQAVLAEVDAAEVDLIVFTGDVTWGPEPQATVDIVRGLGDRAVCVRGNADRAVVELAREGRAHTKPRDPWMPKQHSEDAIDFLASFAFNIVVDIDGLGAVRFCHGSPRGDTEAVTPVTSEQRYTELSAGIPEMMIVTGHTHIQFDRRVAGRRSVNPGSVGLPYHLGEPGTAYWAVLGPDVELRQTHYDIEEAIRRTRATDDPTGEDIIQMLLKPPTPQEITEYAENLVFAD